MYLFHESIFEAKSITMLKNRIKQIALSLTAATLFFSCVPSRQFEELKSKQAKCEEDKASLMDENTSLKSKITEQEEQLAAITKRIKALENDTAIMGNSLRKLTINYDKLDQTYDRLLEQMAKIEEGGKEDNKKLMAELQSTKEDLQKKEDELRKLELALNSKENNLNNANSELAKSQKDLEKSQKDLEEREKRLKELEGVLSRKDSTVKALKDKITEALLGFKESGLTVELKNGKVYVSVEERLLFASGSWAVDVKGQDALKKLAKVLETQPDVNIMIEGHTDDVPYNGSGNVKDNWDLSVMRATAIVKILTANSKISPKQLTAAGRSEYLPLDAAKTADARKKNRRTEIIITPKLDELFQILESN